MGLSVESFISGWHNWCWIRRCNSLGKEHIQDRKWFEPFWCLIPSDSVLQNRMLLPNLAQILFYAKDLDKDEGEGYEHVIIASKCNSSSCWGAGTCSSAGINTTVGCHIIMVNTWSWSISSSIDRCIDTGGRCVVDSTRQWSSFVADHLHIVTHMVNGSR